MSSRRPETSPSRSASVDTSVEHSSTSTPKTAASSPTSVTAVDGVANSVRRDTDVDTVHDKEDDGSVASSSSSSSAPTCRFCLDEEGDGALGPLVSPCRCAGGQRYVHEGCLRRWQRTVAASSSGVDDRGAVCRVCATPFSIAPPTRAELVRSIVGPALAGEVREGALVAASPGFSRELSRDVRRTPAALRRRAAAAGGHAHWYGAVLLVVAVGTEEDRAATLEVDSVGLLETLRGGVVADDDDDDDRVLVEIPARRAPDGRARRLAATASPRSPAPPGGFARWFLRDLTAADLPVHVSLRAADDDGDDPGRDDVVAVNLVRPIGGAGDDDATTARPAWAAATRIPNPAAVARVRLPPGVVATHCVGGPCEDDAVRCCLVPGGPDGWTVVRATDDDDDASALRRAVATAERRVARTCPAGLFSGRPVVARGLTRATELNGRRGVACRYRADDDRWSVRMEGETERRRIRAANLEPTSDVLEVTCAWGCARWSRSQLLGEIARGSWGLCRADAGDLVERPDRRRANCEDRLAYAPPSEMSDDYARPNDDDDDDDMEEEDEATRIWLDELLELNDVGMDEAEEEGDDDDSVDDNMDDDMDDDDTESDDLNDDMEDEESLLEEDLSRSSNDQNDDVMEEEEEEDTEEEDLPLVG